MNSKSNNNNDIPDNSRPVGEFLKEMYDDMTFSEKLEYH